ncbi:MAG: hypothetical protein ACLSVD_16565 [Eggerthellaceae bacterium]
MLEKLFKYDMKALSRVLVPLHIAALALAAVACICGFVGFSMGEASMSSGSMSNAAELIAAAMLVALAFSVLGIFSATIATIVVIIHRFYKNLFTDEGYLTLTLPVTANQIMLSKVLAGSLWLLIDALVVLASAFAVSLAATGFVNASIDSTLPYWMLSAAGGDMADGVHDWLTVLSGMAGAAIQGVMTLLVAYAAFAGAVGLAAQGGRGHRAVPGHILGDRRWAPSSTCWSQAGSRSARVRTARRRP